jgi:two-component system, sporulation sensor kinase D
MDIYRSKQQYKLLLLLIAIVMGVWSLWYTNKLVNDLRKEEQQKLEIWAEATRMLSSSANQNTDVTFLLKIIEYNNTVPVILTDKNYNVLYQRNLNIDPITNEDYLEEIRQMASKHDPIVIELGNKDRNYIFYKESTILKKLTLYPYIQLLVVLFFVVVSYIAFNSSRKAEQNKVWLGLSRETAHQLGTPASSLTAWVEILKEKHENEPLISELEKDVNRLNVITERFSKIGSQPKLEEANLNQALEDVINYMRRRTPGTIKIDLDLPPQTVTVPLNINLFGWVIENLTKNALDALPNKGFIDVKVMTRDGHAIIDVTDNGKGIPMGNFKKIFKPGYTTKSRGWGLGLSLTKRIIEHYHQGSISVLQSGINIGTTIRIIIPLAKAV